jgi:sortase (surface protein transpeptidase)
MKKSIMETIFFIMGALILSGCSKPNDNATVKSEASTQQSAKKSSESSQQANSEASTSERPKEPKISKSRAFKLMIEADQSQIPKLKEQYVKVYSDISIFEGESNIVIYKYTFNEAPAVEVDAEALKPTLVKSLKPTVDTAKVMISDIKIQVIYLKPYGSKTMNFVITRDDIDQVQLETK